MVVWYLAYAQEYVRHERRLLVVVAQRLPLVPRVGVLPSRRLGQRGTRGVRTSLSVFLCFIYAA
jgi:hypothetical protein